jgi:arginine decarboxylase
VPNIQTIKKATVEAARFYCEIKKMGFPMELMDVGGGLGIDYDGSRSNYESSMNYTMREYARDVVYNIKTVCQDSGIEVPDIVTESGRAVVAPHSILITEVCDRISKTTVPPKAMPKRGKVNPVLRDLQAILDNTHKSSPLERYHDAQQKKKKPIASSALATSTSPNARRATLSTGRSASSSAIKPRKALTLQKNWKVCLR